MTSSMQAIKNRLSQPNMSPFAFDPDQAQTAIVNLDHLRAYRIKGEDAGLAPDGVQARCTAAY